MRLFPLRFKPGINRDQTNYSGEGGWFAGDKIRFFSGFPQKLGGWVKASQLSFLGVCRQMLNWVTSYSDNLLGIGTNNKVYLEAGGSFYDITPIRATFISPNTDNCFATTAGSSTVVVSIVNHGAIQNDFVTFSGVSGAIGGIPEAYFNQEFTVNEILDINLAPDPDKFEIVVGDLKPGEYTQIGTQVDAVVNQHGFVPGNTVFINVLTGGSPSGPFVVLANPPPTADTFSFTSSTSLNVAGTLTARIAATTTVGSGGGTAIQAEFQINVGFDLQTEGYGWGTSTWGRGAWGSGSDVPVLFEARTWWMDNFDNDMVFNINNGPIYYWIRGVNAIPDFSVRAILLSDLPGAADVPDQAGQILISQNDKHLLAFGATPFGGGDLDPLLIRWATQDDPGMWTPMVTNSAGFLRVSRGSRIVRALPTRQEILVWTDSHLYSLQFLGTADVFGLQEYADNISIISSRAVATASNVTYWMGIDKFYMYTGRVETLPCTLRNFVFDDFNFGQSFQVIAGTNEGYNEIWWFYPSKDSTVNNRYVVYNHLEQIWYYGNLPRTAWLDSPVREFPQATEYNIETGRSFLYQHENGSNADGLPMISFVESNDFDIDSGDRFILSKRIIPDVSFNASNLIENPNPAVNFSVKFRNFPGSFSREDPNDTQPVVESQVGQFTEQIFVRARARQMALKVSSADLGVQWQLGTPRLEGKEDGRR
jgi:hypothetical protein